MLAVKIHRSWEMGTPKLGEGMHSNMICISQAFPEKQNQLGAGRKKLIDFKKRSWVCAAVVRYNSNFSREPGDSLLFPQLDQDQLIGLSLKYKKVLREKEKRVSVCGGGKENIEVGYFLSQCNITSRNLTLDSDIPESKPDLY